MNGPVRLVPFLRPMVWGGRRLGEALGKPLPTPEPYGESWDVSDHALHRSVVANGPAKGRSLRELMLHQRAELLGPAAETYAVFPWLVKFLDAGDWLSVQVHPDEKAVRALWPGEGSKTEAWFVLDADPGSRVYAGLLPGVKEADMRKALAAGRAAECLHQFEPRPGDCVFLPAGTVHAVGGGVLMAEVQQTSDATFRLFDWNRRDAQGNSRKLHIEEALASIHWDAGPVTPVRVERYRGPRSNQAPGGPRRQRLVECPYFVLECLQGSAPFVCEARRGPRVLIVIQGRGLLVCGRTEEPMAVGQAWMVPDCAGAVECRPAGALTVLSCFLPG